MVFLLYLAFTSSAPLKLCTKQISTWVIKSKTDKRGVKWSVFLHPEDSLFFQGSQSCFARTPTTLISPVYRKKEVFIGCSSMRARKKGASNKNFKHAFIPLSFLSRSPLLVIYLFFTKHNRYGKNFRPPQCTVEYFMFSPMSQFFLTIYTLPYLHCQNSHLFWVS